MLNYSQLKEENLYNETFASVFKAEYYQKEIEKLENNKVFLSDMLSKKQFEIDNLNNQFKTKLYPISQTIKANETFNVTIENISGYTPIASYYECESDETTTHSLCPRRKLSSNIFMCGILNAYSQNIQTVGTLHV